MLRLIYRNQRSGLFENHVAWKMLGNCISHIDFYSLRIVSEFEYQFKYTRMQFERLDNTL